MRVQSLGDYHTLQGAGEALGLSYGQVWRTIQQMNVPTLLLGRTLLVKLEDLRVRLAMSAVAASRQMADEAASTPISRPLPAAPSAAPDFRVTGHVCPECGGSPLVYEEGCQKCYACGWSAC